MKAFRILISHSIQNSLYYRSYVHVTSETNYRMPLSVMIPLDKSYNRVNIKIITPVLLPINNNNEVTNKLVKH